MVKSDYVVVLSGGLDSATLLYHVLNEDNVGGVTTVTFDYGQRHRKEIEAAASVAAAAGVPNDLIEIKNFAALAGNSALTANDIDVPEGHYEDANMQVTVVPNRNAIFANLALAKAIDMSEYAQVVLGIHAGDHAIYADCRPEFIEHLNLFAERVYGVSKCSGRFKAPFVHKDKTYIVKRAVELGVPTELTWTCYNGLDMHCGVCATCVERQEAFHLAGHKDAVMYEDETYWKVVTNNE